MSRSTLHGSTLRRTWPTVAAGLLALTTAACAAPASADSPAEARAGDPPATPYVPKPTGRAFVGTTALHLKDPSRPDPWVPEVEQRELMVSLWYPARGPGRTKAAYMTPQESELLLKSGDITSVPYDILSKTRTNAYTGVLPAARRNGLPLVVMSPGFTKPRKVLTSLAEDLASRGYVVAAIDHTYENSGMTFPDGRTVACAACDVPNHDDAFWAKVQHGRAADVSFVLDALTGPRAKGSRTAGLIDTDRIAMVGHSVGGASAGISMLADQRIRAGMNIDGGMHTPLPETGLSRPFMFLGTQETHAPGGDRSWERDWQRLTGWKRWMVVKGAVHPSFTDVGLLGEQLGIMPKPGLPSARGTVITRAYVNAFLDRHLRDRESPLLDRPGERYPEVLHCDGESCA